MNKVLALPVLLMLTVALSAGTPVPRIVTIDVGTCADLSAGAGAAACAPAVAVSACGAEAVVAGGCGSRSAASCPPGPAEASTCADEDAACQPCVCCPCGTGVLALPVVLVECQDCERVKVTDGRSLDSIELEPPSPPPKTSW